MRKIRCENCRAIFDEDEVETRHEAVGEFWGQLAYDVYEVCPECGSDELEDIEIPYDECEDYPECDYNCEGCKLMQEKEAGNEG